MKQPSNVSRAFTCHACPVSPKVVFLFQNRTVIALNRPNIKSSHSCHTSLQLRRDIVCLNSLEVFSSSLLTEAALFCFSPGPGCSKAARGGGGGGYFQKNWVGVCGPLPKNPTLFMTKICDIPYPIYDLTKNSKPYL